MSKDNTISFRKLEEKDLTRMHKWLNTDFVIKWWNEGGKTSFTYDAIYKTYMPRIIGEQPTHPYIIVHNKTDIGYIQTYLIEDYPDYSQYIQANESAAGLDLFIGEKEFIHKGLGKSIIKEFLNKYVFDLTNAVSCIIGPEPKNKVAIRAYEKVGFTYLKTIQIPDEQEPEYLMRLTKNDLND